MSSSFALDTEGKGQPDPIKHELATKSGGAGLCKIQLLDGRRKGYSPAKPYISIRTGLRWPITRITSATMRSRAFLARTFAPPIQSLRATEAESNRTVVHQLMLDPRPIWIRRLLYCCCKLAWWCNMPISPRRFSQLRAWLLPAGYWKYSDLRPLGSVIVQSPLCCVATALISTPTDSLRTSCALSLKLCCGPER